MQIGQDCALWFDSADPIQSLVQIEVAWMWALAERVDDPDVEAGQCRDAFRRQSFDVGGIGNVAKTKAKGRDVAVVLQHRQGFDRARLTVDCDRFSRQQALLR